MSPRRESQVDIGPLLRMIDAWPRSWAGIEDDVRIGEQLVALLRHLIVHLRDSGLTRKQIRVHLDNTWAICGEIIRGVHENDERRR